MVNLFIKKIDYFPKKNITLSRDFVGTPLFTTALTDNTYTYTNYVSKWCSSFNS